MPGLRPAAPNVLRPGDADVRLTPSCGWTDSSRQLTVPDTGPVDDETVGPQCVDVFLETLCSVELALLARCH
jgi:hypothetical protein